jgi:AMP-binding enzyme
MGSFSSGTASWTPGRRRNRGARRAPAAVVGVGTVTRTVAALWWRAASEPSAHAPFMVEEAGGWRSVGWDETGRRVEEMAAGFLAFGIRPGDRVAILGGSRLEWTLADFAPIATGAVVVPVYATATPADRAHVLSHSAARLPVCEDARERERVARLPGLGRLERALTMDPSGADLEELGERGRHHLRRDAGAVARARAAIWEDDLLTLVYTSGTTGPPKGCMVTHRNLRAMVDMARRIEGLVRPGDVVLLHLPLAHVFARLIQFLTPAVGMTLAFCPDLSRLGSALTAVRRRSCRASRGSSRRCTPRRCATSSAREGRGGGWWVPRSRPAGRPRGACARGTHSARGSTFASCWPTGSSTHGSGPASAGGCGSPSRAAEAGPRGRGAVRSR